MEEAWRSRKIEVLTQYKQIVELRSYGLSVSAIHRMLMAKGDINMPLRSFSYNVSKLNVEGPIGKEDSPSEATPQKAKRPKTQPPKDRGADHRAGGQDETTLKKLQRFKRNSEKSQRSTFEIPDAFSEEFGKDAKPPADDPPKSPSTFYIPNVFDEEYGKDK